MVGVLRGMGVLLFVEKNREEERNGWKKKNEKG
jgi:hypothetical protein